MTKQFELFPFEENMRLKLKKNHPCGGDSWQVIRVGADVKIQCESCGHYLLLARRKLEQACKEILPSPGKL